MKKYIIYSKKGYWSRKGWVRNRAEADWFTMEEAYALCAGQ